jgi:hypothetical protein
MTVLPADLLTVLLWCAPTPQNHPTKSLHDFAGTPDRCTISRGPRRSEVGS